MTNLGKRVQNMSILDFIGAKDDGDGGNNYVKHAKLSSSQIITTNKPTPSILQAGCSCCHLTNSVEALKEKVSHSTHLLTPCSALASSETRSEDLDFK